MFFTKRRGFAAFPQSPYTVSMSDPILGFHFILSAYGFWLPNDPRGSWSEVVRRFDLLRLGHATKINTTRSVADQPHDVRGRFHAKRSLRYPPVQFSGIHARAVAHGFAQALTEHDYVIHALAILQDHLHLVMAWHQRHIDQIASHLKAKATMRLNREGLHPLAGHASPTGRIPSPWARNYWCPFITSRQQMRIAIRYVQANPVKAGLRPQRWKLVTPYIC
jgi:REP-associated tyrosine transposase